MEPSLDLHTILSMEEEFLNTCGFDCVLTCISLFMQLRFSVSLTNAMFSLVWSVCWAPYPPKQFLIHESLDVMHFLQSLDFDFIQVSNALLYWIFNQWFNDYSFIQHGFIKHPQSTKNLAQWGDTLMNGLDPSSLPLILLLLNTSFLFLLNFDVESFLFYFAFLWVLNSGILMHGIGDMSFGRAEKANEDQNESEMSNYRK